MIEDFTNLLCLVVSHPHGCAKHITVGKTERFIKDGALIKARFTAIPQQEDIRFLGPPSGRLAGDGARIRDKGIHKWARYPLCHRGPNTLRLIEDN
ncbi:hypothetical protein PoB_002974400 [Plakobranchus ocellatus]|uniref:Uncharacterized protein n=1 Tax=Plakobranchus ocellatus TaxID=259542 RepID=A0AAV4AAH4_9GAST|nr:hypothetical protein PoB_002974400 [Plakobranchus ocellatus]